MTITLELSPEQEARLAAQAQAAGMADPADYLRAVIDGEGVVNEQREQSILPDVHATAVPEPMTGAELLEYWKRNNLIGQIFMDGPDSPELARQLRRQAETRSGHSGEAQQSSK